MRTVTYQSVLKGIAALMGLDTETADLSPKKARTYNEFINGRVLEGWGWDFWPDVIKCEQRAYRDEYDATVTYAIDDEVYYDGGYYTCIQAGTGQSPDTETAYWEVTTNLDKYIAYEQPGETVIETVNTVSASNPRINQAYPGFYGFEPSDNGIQVSDLAGALVWLVFRTPAPEFTSDTWSNTTAYIVGNSVYYPTTGECYRCVQNHTGTTPGSDEDYWVKINFPAFLAPFVKAAGYADALRKDGQQDKAAVEEDRAYDVLGQIHDRIFAQQGQVKRVQVRV
jgi:hypothetical protein